MVCEIALMPFIFDKAKEICKLLPFKSTLIKVKPKINIYSFMTYMGL